MTTATERMRDPDEWEVDAMMAERAATPPAPELPVLRPFTKVDWYGFAGAEEWSPTHPPYLAEATVLDWPEALPDDDDEADPFGVVCIVDKRGVSFWGVDGGFTLDVTDHDLACAVATRLLSAPISAAVLRVFGFAACNLPEAK